MTMRAREAKEVLTADKLAKRPAHPLLDKSVILRDGARVPAAFRKDTWLDGDGVIRGFVWNVDAATGRAIVDFGSEAGAVIVSLSDLIEVRS